MQLRRSGRITSRKPNYNDSPTSDEDADDPSSEESDEDEEDYDFIPRELLTLLHGAITEAIGAAEKREEDPVAVVSKHKRKRQDNQKLQPPPIHPVDLASLIALCKCCQSTQYVDCQDLYSVLAPLQELEQMVGLQTVKQSVVDFIILHLQADSIHLPEMRHMILAGPPGCGKTTISTIIAKIMSRLSLCTTDKIVYGTQANLIGSYLGQTAPKTEALIRSAFGGVLVIDEASSLADGRSDQSSDSFSKSCIDTLNRMLSEHGDKFVCIVAGYKEEIYRDILSINPGMDRRFSTRFEIPAYTADELLLIMNRHFERRGATLVTGIGLQWVKDNMCIFKNAGGDCLRVVDTIMMEHAKRSFGKKVKNTLTTMDINLGLDVVRKQHMASKADVPGCIAYMYT